MSSLWPTSGGIYELHFAGSSVFYGGRTNCFRVRWKAHRKALAEGAHTNRALQGAYDIFGNFEPSVLEEITDGPARIEAERLWLAVNYGKAGCLNISRTPGGDPLQKIWSETFHVLQDDEGRWFNACHSEGSWRLLGEIKSMETGSGKRKEILEGERLSAHMTGYRNPRLPDGVQIPVLKGGVLAS